MSLFEILKREYDLVVNPIEKFDLVDLSQYFNEEENYYKHTRGVIAQMTILVSQLNLDEVDKTNLMLAAHLHQIAYSKRVKRRGHKALDSAIFSLECALGEDVALAIMFQSTTYAQIKKMAGKQLYLYDQAYELFKQNEKAKFYCDLLTYCDLHTETDGSPTTVSRRIFKMLASLDKKSVEYKTIKANRRKLKKLDKRIRMSVIKEKSLMEQVLDILKAKA